MSRSAVDPASVDLAALRRRRLVVHVAVAALSIVLCVIALIGGARSVIAILVILALTFTALALDLRGWRGAGEIWAGRADPARLRTLSLWSLAFGVPALVATVVAAVPVMGPPLARLVGLLVRHWPGSSTSWGLDGFGAVRWTDPFVVAAVVAAFVASLGAAMLSLHLRRPRGR